MVRIIEAIWAYFCTQLRFLVCFPVRSYFASLQDIYYSLLLLSNGLSRKKLDPLFSFSLVQKYRNTWNKNVWNIWTPSEIFYSPTKLIRVYKGGPNILPIPPRSAWPTLLFIYCMCFWRMQRWFRTIAKNYISPWIQRVEIFHLKYSISLP